MCLPLCAGHATARGHAVEQVWLLPFSKDYESVFASTPTARCVTKLGFGALWLHPALRSRVPCVAFVQPPTFVLALPACAGRS